MNKTKLLSALYLMFLALLFASGSLTGFVSEAVYYLSFLLPAGLGLFVARREECRSLVSFDSGAFKLALPTVMPIILTVILVSRLTSLVIYSLFGVTSDVELGDNILLAMLTHALLPAVLEELLFRYMPMRLFGSENRASLVLVSSLAFALVHNDLFVIPYAFIAGVLLMTVNLITDSIWPSVIIHALNNALSVILLFYSQSLAFTHVFFAIIVLFALLSAAFLVKKRRAYVTELARIFGGSRISVGSDMLYLAVPTLMLAFIDLLDKI